MAVISDELAQAINNLSPGHQVHEIGKRLQEALAGEMPAGSVSTAELANNAVTGAKILDGEVDTADIAGDAITSAKILDGEVATADIAANAVTLAKVAAGLLIGITVDDARTMSREENVDGLASAIALANALTITMDAHAADAVEHGTAADAVNFPLTSPVATDLTDMITLVTEQLLAYEAHNADAVLGAAWVFHNAQQAGNALASAVAPTTLAECITRLNDIKAKYNTHESSAVSHTVGSAHTEAAADGAYGVANLVPETDVLVGDLVVWSIIDSGTGTVIGASAVAGVAGITFTFDADPQDDCIITYAVFRAAP